MPQKRRETWNPASNFERLELIKKQQHQRAEAHKAAEEAKKSTMAQLEARRSRRFREQRRGERRGEPMARDSQAAVPATVSLLHFAKGCQDFNFLQTHGFSVLKPLKGLGF